MAESVTTTSSLITFERSVLMGSQDTRRFLNLQQSQWEDVGSQLVRAHQQYEDLTYFLAKHQSTSDTFGLIMNEWRFQLYNSGIDEHQVRSFARYRQAFESLLDQGRLHIMRREEESHAIVNAMRLKLAEIDDLEARKASLASSIDQTRQDLTLQLNLESSTTA